jgi:hypothetical protein
LVCRVPAFRPAAVISSTSLPRSLPSTRPPDAPCKLLFTAWAPLPKDSLDIGHIEPVLTSRRRWWWPVTAYPSPRRVTHD